MNIFYLDENPVLAAQYQCDKHVVKMCLESVQLLSAAWHILSPKSIEMRWSPSADDKKPFPTIDGIRIYAKTHHNHPSAKWVRETSDNYQWMVAHTQALFDEYKKRYGRDHKSVTTMAALKNTPSGIRLSSLTPMPQAMPDDCKIPGDSVAAYRLYYNRHKARFAVWKNSTVPYWFKPEI